MKTCSMSLHCNLLRGGLIFHTACCKARTRTASPAVSHTKGLVLTSMSVMSKYLAKFALAVSLSDVIGVYCSVYFCADNSRQKRWEQALRSTAEESVWTIPSLNEPTLRRLAFIWADHPRMYL